MPVLKDSNLRAFPEALPLVRGVDLPTYPKKNPGVLISGEEPFNGHHHWNGAIKHPT